VTPGPLTNQREGVGALGSCRPPRCGLARAGGPKRGPRIILASGRAGQSTSPRGACPPRRHASNQFASVCRQSVGGRSRGGHTPAQEAATTASTQSETPGRHDTRTLDNGQQPASQPHRPTNLRLHLHLHQTITSATSLSSRRVVFAGTRHEYDRAVCPAQRGSISS